MAIEVTGTSKEAAGATGVGEAIVIQGAHIGAGAQESSASVQPKIDRVLESLRAKAHEHTKANPPRLVQEGFASAHQYGEFVGDCLATLTKYLREKSAPQGQALAAGVPDVPCAQLGGMTLKFSATKNSVHLQLFEQGQSYPGIIASVQDTPMPRRDTRAAKTQRWTMVAVLAGNDTFTDEYLDIPVVTSLPFLRDLKDHEDKRLK